MCCVISAVRRPSLLALTVLAILLLAPAGAGALTLGNVDPTLGTGWPDNAFVGAQVPFGFAAPGPDTVLPTTSGYTPGQPVLGFSVTHESGTGGAAKYGNFRVTPGIPVPNTAPGPMPILSEHATPGYYSVVLGPQGIRAELTASRMAAMMRFTYPAAPQATLTLDAASVIQNSAHGEVAKPVWVRVKGRRAFEGGGLYSGGWGGGSYRLFFWAELDRAARLSVAPGGRVVVASFDTSRRRSVTLRIGISFTSTKMAAQHLSELPRFDFDAARRAAQAQWRAVLGEVQVSGGSARERRIFGTAFYHSHLMPHDVTGDGAWPAGAPHYEDFFTLWDTFRTVDPLLTLTEPERMTAMVNSLITTYELTGWLPDARIATHNGYTQVGSNGDVLVADALVKGLRGIDYKTAYKALLEDGDVESPAPTYVGRVLADWKRLHYVAMDQIRSAARTLEYSYDDFAIYEVARALHHPGQAARYLGRSGYWANLWDPATQSIHPRNPDGSFLSPFDPTQRGFNVAPFYEGSGLEYSTFVPHDVQGLINRLGGDQAFTGWLDHVLACCYNPGNEPALLAPWLYIHAGRPDLTDAAVRRLLASAYGTGRQGLPGNDDAGAISAWYVWGAMGLYPNAGQPYYYIGAPLFTRVRISLGNGRTFTVYAPHASASKKYVVAARLNGRSINRAFLTSSEVERGGTLRLTMSSRPNRWGSGRRPFSVSRAGASNARP